ncbi:TetR/AcrR family transcriptional regulator [Allokutzneria albata]|uniref:DNA-binding transcriptional regulator, AcrR family n=1 Tax=Allokutzneria albata TaxID=211114 RepID=A0A1G9Y0P0_ALLAB|nr:TetR/AcrR family transcriptional regulator [Allokutzneria albata]SDN02005.1 DNA-binding transcriptional regulator, AcrR family [Allokutzneria albata]
MARLSRAQTQANSRAKILAAARDEFAERGFRDAKIDAIAERAGFTRGAVYSNFPGKRALYFAVLANLSENAPMPPHAEPSLTAQEALGAIARAWVARLPLADIGERDGSGRLSMDLMPEVTAETRTRLPYTQLMRLNAVLLGLALERLEPRRGRMVRIAETALTTLHGATQMAAAAPGFVEPFNVVKACEQLAALDLADSWPTPPIIAPVKHVDEPWSPPSTINSLRSEPADLSSDGVVAVLGLHRLSAAEEVVRAARAHDKITVAVVTSDPAELTPLARLAVADLWHCLRQAFPEPAWPSIQLVFDADAELAAAAGVPAVSDVTEVAVRFTRGRIIARSEGYGACHSATSVTVDQSARTTGSI